MPSQPNSHKVARFDPFLNRLSRDIRNELSESLVETIHAGNVGDVWKAGACFSEYASPI